MAKNAIVLIIDGLQSAFLSPYGNTWIKTPGFDTLAAESFVFDQAIADSTDLAASYARFWLIGSPHKEGAAVRQAIPASVATLLLTDDPLVASLPGAARFERVTLLDPPVEETASELEETHFAALFAAASDSVAQLTEGGSSWCLWLHTQGLRAPWDAPLELRRQYADEDDPEPPDFCAVPRRTLQGEIDPDELLGIAHAYAGQVSLLDTCLQAFLDDLRETPAGQETMVVLLAPRGLALGEHGHIGPDAPRLHGEELHVPWLVRLPDGTGAASRTQALVQPGELSELLAAWWGSAPETSSASGADDMESGDHAPHRLWRLIVAEPTPLRDRAISTTPSGNRAIRTPAWFYSEASATDGASPFGQLYLKPDDRFEVNEVSSRCEEHVLLLRQALDSTSPENTSDRAPSPPPLPDLLLYGPQ